MKRIPPDVDQLMWALAEDPEPSGLAEFERRFPDYVGELGKRLAMVRGLKGSGPRVERDHSIPDFQPRNIPTPSWQRPATFLAAVVILCTLAVASFVVTRSLLRPDSESAPRPIATRPPEQTSPIGRPEVIYTNPGARQPIQDPAPRSEALDFPDLTFRIEGAPLLDALRALAMQAGFELQIAPGMEDLNEVIDADYIAANPMTVFVDLGKKHGFTAFYQGERKVLLIPAVDTATETERLSGTEPKSDGEGNPAPDEGFHEDPLPKNGLEPLRR